MRKLVLVIRAQEGGLRMNASSADQSRGPERWSTILGNVLGNSVGTDKHYRNIGQGEVLKYLRRKPRSREMVCHPGERSKKFCWY